MKTKLIVLMLAALLVLPLVLTACVSSPATAATGTAVSIEGFAFNPKTLTIEVGTTVTWTNNDTAGHDVKGDAFASPRMPLGGTFSFTFDTAGTFEYICGVHPSMKGTIIVE